MRALQKPINSRENFHVFLKVVPILFLAMISLFLIDNWNVMAVSDNQTNSLIMKGLDLFNQSSYAEAIKYYDRALAIDPNNTDALNDKADAIRKSGNNTEALKFYDRALAIDPNNTDALNDKALSLQNLGDYGDALMYYDKALAIDPNYLDSINNKGIIYESLKNYSEALKYFDKALSIEPNNFLPVYNKGNLYSDLKNYREALKFYDKALSIEPNNRYALYAKDAALNNLNNYSSNKNYLLTVPNGHLADFTIMVYMVGSDLEGKSYAATQSIREMEEVGSKSNINILIETGGGNSETTVDDKRFIDFTKVQRHKVLHNEIQTLADLGQQNMGDPKSLSEFLTWGMSEYPAKKYVVILWDHGSGINGFGGDEQFNDDKLDINEINQAFSNTTNSPFNEIGYGKKIELIGFDSCLMASVEVANSIAQFGRYMVAPEEIEPQWGWNYSSILKSLVLAPNQNGSELGKTIANSFYKKSESLSISQGYNAQQEVTISLVNLTAVPELVANLDTLAHEINSKMTDFKSVIGLEKSIDSAERFGQTSKGTSGLVDLADVASNIKQRFPQSSKLIDAVQNSTNATVIYKINGELERSASGLSLYAPIREEEFSEARKFTLPSWQKIVDFLYITTKYDNDAPVVQSTVKGNTIKGNIYAKDISKITMWMYSSSMPEGNTVIYQDLDPSSFIKKDGSFEYTWNRQILSLCTERDGQRAQQQTCKPALVKLESSKNKKIVIIPVRLESSIDKLDEPVSLKYETTNDRNFTFLGARPDIEEGEPKLKTVPKENWPLYGTDIIYPAAYSFESEDDNINDFLNVDYGPMQVKDNFKPKYVLYNGTFDILFRVCDYSSNCWSTRWFHFDESSPMMPQVIDLSGQNISSCNNSTIKNRFSMYGNPTYHFRIFYPSGWQKVDQDNPDTTVVGFYPPEFNKIDNPAQVQIESGYWPGTLREFQAIVTNPYILPLEKIINKSSTNLGGFPAYSNTMTNHEDVMVQTMTIDSLIGHTWYSITFMSGQSEFLNYLPYFNEIADSFQICQNKEAFGAAEQVQHYGILSIQNYTKYTNPVYNFKMVYPSDWLQVKNNDNPREINFFSPITVQTNASSFNRTESYPVEFSVSDFGNASILNHLSLDEFSNQLIDRIKQDNTGFNLYESNPTIFHGSSAYEITYSYLNPVSRTVSKQTTIITIAHNEIYFLSYMGESSRYEYYLPTFKHILDSLMLNTSPLVDN